MQSPGCIHVQPTTAHSDGATAESVLAPGSAAAPALHIVTGMQAGNTQDAQPARAASSQREALQYAQLLQVNSTELSQMHSYMRNTGPTAYRKGAGMCGSHALRSVLARFLLPCSGIQCWLKSLLMHMTDKLAGARGTPALAWQAAS